MNGSKTLLLQSPREPWGQQAAGRVVSVETSGVAGVSGFLWGEEGAPRFPFWGDGNVLRRGPGDGCAALGRGKKFISTL